MYSPTQFSIVSHKFINMHPSLKGRVSAPLLRIGRAVICNGKSAIQKMGKLTIKGYCGYLASALLSINFVLKLDVLFTI